MRGAWSGGRGGEARRTAYTFPAGGGGHAHAKHIYHAYAAYAAAMRGPLRVVPPAASCPFPHKTADPFGLASRSSRASPSLSLSLSLSRSTQAENCKFPQLDAIANGPANPRLPLLPSPYLPPYPPVECKFQMQLFIVTAGGIITLLCTVPTPCGQLVHLPSHFTGYP